MVYNYNNEGVSICELKNGTDGRVGILMGVWKVQSKTLGAAVNEASTGPLSCMIAIDGRYCPMREGGCCGALLYIRYPCGIEGEKLRARAQWRIPWVIQTLLAESPTDVARCRGRVARPMVFVLA